MRSLRYSAVLLLALLAAPAAAAALGGAVRDAAACAQAAATAAREADVPEAWLQAIALVESGRQQSDRHIAWPWAVNDHGEGFWFPRKHDAVRHVERQLATGRTSVDVGCFQINWRWHGQAFDSVAAAFDPLANARYAAAFLRQLYKETGTWPNAVGRYHSATPALGLAYRSRVARMRAAVAQAPAIVRVLRPPRHAGAVTIALQEPIQPLLRPAAPLLRQASPLLLQPGRPLLRQVRRVAKGADRD